MTITRREKERQVAEIKDRVQKAVVIVLADYRGLNVTEAGRLRRELREHGVEFKVIKNTLAARAVRELGYDELAGHFQGPTAIALGYDDPVNPAKVLLKFGKENDKLVIKAGFLEGAVIDPDKVKSLGALPGREVLLAQVCGAFSAPLAGLANVLQGNIRNLVYVLQAVKEAREKSA